jgi:tRNA-dihydrouridine synthase A
MTAAPDPELQPSPWRFCVAPMMEWTDRHCRHFHRQLSRRARLYTEMVTSGAILHGRRDDLLRFDPTEHPVALQLGGSEADALARSAEIGARYGYDEINLNCGCPSDRVQEGRFGACLMLEPDRVAVSVRAMRGASDVPVTVKCRIGVDDSEDYAFLRRFVEAVAAQGCSVFIVHARTAWLSGLSPKENREIPPLHYDTVYRLKQDYPQLTVVLNGGVQTLDDCQRHLRQVDGVMLGRTAYENPWLLAGVDPRLFGERAAVTSREQALQRLRPYVERELAQGTRLSHITRHLLGLYRHQPGGKTFRRLISQGVTAPGADWSLIEAALAATHRPPDAAAA